MLNCFSAGRIPVEFSRRWKVGVRNRLVFELHFPNVTEDRGCLNGHIGHKTGCRNLKMNVLGIWFVLIRDYSFSFYTCIKRKDHFKSWAYVGCKHIWKATKKDWREKKLCEIHFSPIEFLVFVTKDVVQTKSFVFVSLRLCLSFPLLFIPLRLLS